jgi:hypothetical protein
MARILISIKGFQALAQFTHSVFKLASFAERSNNRAYLSFMGHVLGVSIEAKEPFSEVYFTNHVGDH